jgi:hypothetical protein
VAVEKLASQGSAEIGSLQDALQTICRARLDIFYPQIWPRFLGLRVFQQPRLLATTEIHCLPLDTPDAMVLAPSAMRISISWAFWKAD